jgi:DNA-binding NtrC family response regulator
MPNTAELKIIVVERKRGLADRIPALLPERKCSVAWESSIDHVLERFEKESFDLLIVTSRAFRAGEISGVELLEVIATKSPRTQILFLTEARDIRTAISALKAGSYHYAKLPIPDEEFRLLIEAALERRPDYGENALLTHPVSARKFDQLVGNAPGMQTVYRYIRQAASTDIPVLLTGETGTGKDLVAQAIHAKSARADAPFVPVHLGALPEDLVAAELFGHEKGAFTGAHQRRQGKFEEAGEGTIFLDEIGTLDERVQISLLRIIEQRRFTRIGGRRVRESQARIIVATNEDLAAAVEQGRFREDLYYRIDVYRIHLPPLRERTGDIPLLVDEFMRRYSAEFSKNIRGIAPECIPLLENYDWPGNVRELKNVIQRAVLVCSGEVLLPEHLHPRLTPGRSARPSVTVEVGASIAEMERELLQATLQYTRNNRTRAAKMLGISRRALYDKLARYEASPDAD